MLAVIYRGMRSMLRNGLPLILGVMSCSVNAAAGQERFGGPPMGTAEGSDMVTIADHSAYWTNAFGIGMVHGDTDDTPGLLVIRGAIRNRAGCALNHVKLAFELVDGDGYVVAAEYGYNRSSEVLRKIDSPIPWTLREPPQLAIPADGSDTFRMIFLRNETPPFASYRIRVLDAAASR